MRRDDNHRHVLVDQRDRPVLELAGGITFGVDIGNFLKLQRAFERDRKARAAAEIKHVPRFGEIARQLLELRFERQGFVQSARHLDQRLRQRLLVACVQHAAGAAGGNGKAGQSGKLTGKSLGRGDADFRPGKRRHHHVALAGDGRGRHVVGAGVAQARERIGGFARLRNANGEVSGRKRHVAVTEFRGDVDLDRQMRKLLEPVTRHHAGIISGAAGGDRNAIERAKIEWQLHRQLHPRRRHVEIIGKRVADHLRLFMDFFRHEMPMVALVDQQHRSLGSGDGALGDLAGAVVDLGAGTRDDHPIAVVQIADFVGKWRERDRVGADIHRALAEADGKRRALARADQKIVFAGEQER